MQKVIKSLEKSLSFFMKIYLKQKMNNSDLEKNFGIIRHTCGIVF